MRMPTIGMGERFGRLLVIRLVGVRPETGRSDRWYEVQCDCGIVKMIVGYVLRNGDAQSCGCLARELKRERNTRLKTTHGQTNSPTYKCWLAIKRRCYYEKGEHYPRYGARGIRVCERWLNSFENFLADMRERPSRRHTVERLDNDKDYAPDNCRWATMLEQGNNRSTNVFLEWEGKRISVKDFMRFHGIGMRHYYAILRRVQKGKTPEQILIDAAALAQAALEEG